MKTKWTRWEMAQRGGTRFMVTDPEGFHRFLGFSETEARKALWDMQRVHRMTDAQYAAYEGRTA